MANLRILQTGMIVWILIFLSFTVMSFLPIVKSSTDMQNGIILILIIPIVLLANLFYYKKKSKINGLYIGIAIVVCCLLLDSMITLPLVIIPKGGSYYDFFTDPGLLIMGIEILLVSYLFWKLKVRPVIDQ